MDLVERDNTTPAQPRRIRAARELRGLTQQEVIGRMARPITAAALSQIERGKVRPSVETMQDLAAALEVPVGFFTAQWPDLGSNGDKLVPFFRDLRATSVRERRRAAASVLLISDLASALELHVRIPEVRIPHYSVSARDPDAIEEAAESVREAWDLGIEPIPHVVRELERHGVVVARLTLGHQSVDAFSAWTSRRPIVLLTEDKTNYVRSRFDAAHELAHLVMHQGAEPGSRSVESQAHDFAAAFLFPRDIAMRSLPARLDASGWTRLAELKRRWGISMGALLFRGRRLRILSPDAYRSAMKYMSARGWRKAEPGDREMGWPEAPLLLERALKTFQLESGRSIEELVQAAHLPLKDILQLIEAAVDRRPVVEF